MTATVDPALLAAVEAAVWQQSPRKRGREYAFTCPREGHNDDNPSARWNRDKATWYCDPCGQGGGVVDLARLLDIIPKANPNAISYRLNRNGAQPIEHRRYTQDDGGKRFGWFTGGSKGLQNRPATSLPLYAVEHLQPGEPVVVCEGEKATDSLIARGIPAVGTVCGASATPTPVALAPLLSRSVTLWPDNDPPGETHMAGINRTLRGLGVTEVRVIEWAGAPDKADAADHPGTDDDVLALITAAPDHVPDATPDTIPRPEMDTSLPDTIIFKWPDTRIRVESIWKDRQGIHAWLTYRTQQNGVLYGPDRLNMQSASGKGSVVRELGNREPRAWGDYLQHVVHLTSEYLKSDGETLTAATYEPKPEPPWLVWPMVKEGVVNVCFGDGGCGKSTKAVAICVSGAAGRSIIPGFNVLKEFATLYVDFEAGPDDVIGAAHALAKGAGLPDGWQKRFIYRRLGGTLADNIELLQRLVVQHSVRLTVIDSLVGSGGADPNEAETARAFFATSSTLPESAVLGLTHVSKEGKRSTSSPLGSVMYRNLPRVVWEMRRDADSNTVGLYPNKINTLGQHPKEFALTLRIEDNQMAYESADISAIPVLATRTSNAAKITYALRNGPMAAKDIAEAAGVPPGSVGTTLNRGRGKLFSQNPATLTWEALETEDPGRSGVTNRHPPVRGAGVIPPEDYNDTYTDLHSEDVTLSAEEEEQEELPWEETP